jgi:hypothetical protein
MTGAEIITLLLDHGYRLSMLERVEIIRKYGG